jgi:hypothetical protein
MTIRERLEAALDASIDDCARCKVCDTQVGAAMTVLGPLLERAETAEAKLVRLPGILRAHYLAQIICDHEQGADQPVCACSLVNLGWHGSVGLAVEAWTGHVLAVLGDNDPKETRHDR